MAFRYSKPPVLHCIPECQRGVTFTNGRFRWNVKKNKFEELSILFIPIHIIFNTNLVHVIRFNQIGMKIIIRWITLVKICENYHRTRNICDKFLFEQYDPAMCSERCQYVVQHFVQILKQIELLYALILISEVNKKESYIYMMKVVIVI